MRVALALSLPANAAVILRTALEDRMLQDELEVYKDYAKRVRYCLVPGIR